jgi:hypothetical protein
MNNYTITRKDNKDSILSLILGWSVRERKPKEKGNMNKLQEDILSEYS